MDNSAENRRLSGAARLWRLVRRNRFRVLGVVIAPPIVVFAFAFISYWIEVFSRTTRFAEEGFDTTRYSFVFVAVSLVLLITIKAVLFGAEHVKKGLGDAKEWAKSLGILATLFVIYAFIYVIPKMDQDKSKEARTANNTVTNLTLQVSNLTYQATHGQVPYQILAKQFEDAKSEASRERKRADSEHSRAEENHNRWRDSLLATNALRDSQEFEKARDYLKVLKKAFPENSLQYEREIAAIREKEYRDKRIRNLEPAYKLWQYTASEFQRMLAERVKKCGGQVQSFVLLPMDELLRGEEGRKKLITGTNCTFEAEYGITQSGFSVSIVGKNSNVSRLHFNYMEPILFLKDEPPIILDRLPTADVTNRINQVDSYLDLLFKSQKDEFQ